MCPVNDTFISGSLDGTVRLWDLRATSCQGILRMSHDNTAFIGHSVVTSFDPSGLILTVGMGKNVLNLYDTRSYDKGPFTTFHIQYDSDFYWYNMKFSNDGRLILLTTQEGIIVVDSYSGALVNRYYIIIVLETYYFRFNIFQVKQNILWKLVFHQMVNLFFVELKLMVLLMFGIVLLVN